MPKPLTAAEAQTIAHTEATGAAKRWRTTPGSNNQKFSPAGRRCRDPPFGAGSGGYFQRQRARPLLLAVRRRGPHAVQAQGEYLYYPDRKEGQFDIGLVNRWGAIQAGAFASFKYINFRQYQQGGGLGQADLLLDYIFSRGRVGGFRHARLQELRRAEQRRTGAGRVQADLRPRSEPAGRELSWWVRGATPSSPATSPICSCARRTMRGRAPT